MAMQIYNTMSRMKEEFVSITHGEIKMYVCGPTVYDYIHIGNARPMIFFDVVRSYLENQQYKVNYVVNFTDVDDKLIRKAEELNTTVADVAERFIAAYFADLEGLGIRHATIHPRVTENMDIILEFIQSLVDKDYAYAKEGDVYFRTRKFADYGKLSHQKLDELQFGIRVEVDKRKENPEDFVLWKAAKPGEVSWESPWGAGRPGWHIECSAMARHYLGDTLDIHGGGQDLQFPHHECECAQSEAVTGKPLSNYWMHNGFIRIDDEKMSKSLGNGILVKDLRQAHKPAAIRYFMLSTHYRNPLNYNADTIQQAENSVDRIANAVNNVKHRLSASDQTSPVDDSLNQRLTAIRHLFHEKMQDDFNTPDAITAIFEWVNEANLLLKKEVVAKASLEALLNLFNEMNEVLRIYWKEEELVDADIDQLITERVEARQNKNWVRADEIRDLLSAQGIMLEDTPQGMRWRRK